MERADPDYFVVNFTTTTYNGGGGKHHVGGAHGALPRTTITPEALRAARGAGEAAQPATACAQSACSRATGQIFLYGDVLVRDALAERPEARMSTEFLHVLRDRSLVRTDRPVESSKPAARSPGAAWSTTTRRASSCCAATWWRASSRTTPNEALLAAVAVLAPPIVLGEKADRDKPTRWRRTHERGRRPPAERFRGRRRRHEGTMAHRRPPRGAPGTPKASSRRPPPAGRRASASGRIPRRAKGRHLGRRRGAHRARDREQKIELFDSARVNAAATKSRATTSSSTSVRTSTR